MALKDHIIDSSKMKEEAIEAIINGFVKYDVTEKTIVFLPNAKTLTSDQRILVYLTALQGWQYLVHEDETVPSSDASPGDVETATSLPGGTVRPRLRALTDKRFIRTTIKGRYAVVSSSYQEIRDSMEDRMN